MIIAIFEINNKEKKLLLFKKTCLLIYFSIDIILRILCFTLKNVKLNFIDLILSSKTQSLIKAFWMTKQIEKIEKIEFVVVALNLKEQTYIVHVTRFASFDSHTKSFWQSLIADLLSANVFKTISYLYIDFADVFSVNLTI